MFLQDQEPNKTRTIVCVAPLYKDLGIDIQALQGTMANGLSKTVLGFVCFFLFLPAASLAKIDKDHFYIM